MKEITVKISKGKHSYKDKESGQQKEMDYIQFEFPNGKTDKYLSNRFNYRIYDYLLDVIDGKEKI